MGLEANLKMGMDLDLGMDQDMDLVQDIKTISSDVQHVQLANT